jgi:hypothetical protein
MLSGEDRVSELQVGLATVPGVQSSPDDKDDDHNSQHFEIVQSGPQQWLCMRLLLRRNDILAFLVVASPEAVAAAESPKSVLPKLLRFK